MIEVLILAIVQGIAEFLPISSSGHLVILGALLGEMTSSDTLEVLSDSSTLEIILHAGTLGSILVIYWRRILDLLVRDRRVILLLFVGTLPAAGVGLAIKQYFEPILKDPLLAGGMLLVTGTLLLILGRMRPRDGHYQTLRLFGAFVIGCFQALAILPGISRSGATIFGARLVGLRNEDSVTFSFLLAIPAILGATLLAVKDLLEPEASVAGLHERVGILIAGAVVAFVVGLVALRWLIGWSRQDRLHWFAWWCLPLGIIVLGVSLTGALS